MTNTPEGPIPARYSTGVRYGGRNIERVWIRPFVAWGAPYGKLHLTQAGDRGQPRYMQRKGQRVRWYDGDGDQVGPEQSNVAPAIAWAISQGWIA